MANPSNPNPQPRRSARLSTLEPVTYFRPPHTFAVFDIVDREMVIPHTWYLVKWWGFKDAKDDTWQFRKKLEEDGFGDMCDFVDKFKDWQEEGKEEEERTFAEFKRSHKVCRFYSVCVCVREVLQ